MKNNLLTLLFFSISILTCCKKDKSDNVTEETYPQTFVAQERKIITYVKVYTKDGEITDKNFLSGYLEKDYEDFFKKDIGTMKAEPDTLIYLSADSVRIILDGHSSLSNTPGANPIKLSPIYKIVKLGDNNFYTDSKNMAQLVNVNPSEFVTDIQRFLKHKPMKLEQPPIFGTPYSFTYYQPFLAVKNAAEVKFPMLNIKLVSTTTIGNFTRESGVALTVNNEFDLEALGTLQAGDTLAVQSSELIFTKR